MSFSSPINDDNDDNDEKHGAGGKPLRPRSVTFVTVDALTLLFIPVVISSSSICVVNSVYYRFLRAKA